MSPNHIKIVLHYNENRIYTGELPKSSIHRQIGSYTGPYTIPTSKYNVIVSK